jgi:MarR family transcriptional regulator, organic hydroperoxide resistance regulator
MDRGLDHELLSCTAREIDWDSFSPAIKKLTDSPSFYLNMVMHLWEKSLLDIVGDFDLTNTQFKMLASLILLTKDERIITQMDLARLLGADKMMVSEVLRTLEKKGYVIRVPHPSDKRAKSLIVTKKGLAIVERAAQHAAEFDDKFFAPLGDDRELFIRLLKKLAQ